MEWIIIIFVLFVVLIMVLSTGFTVKQQTFKVIERLGKFKRIAYTGLNFKFPFIDKVVGADSFRIQQLDVPVETKTKDNVFIVLKISVQYQILREKAFEAFYKLENAEPQITSYVFDVVRAKVPTLHLDDVFEKKDEIASSVTSELKETMDDFGYYIVQALVTDIEPDEKVKAAMNEINAQQRLRLAATEKAEAEKVLLVKAAEAEAESKRLQGEGIANQRKAIIHGLKESVEDFEAVIEGASAKDVMNLVLMTQYFDTLKDIGGHSNSNVVMIPSSPDGFNDIASQIQKSMIVADKVSNPDL